MGWEVLAYAAPLAALILPALLAARLTARAGAMRPAWHLCLAFTIAAVAVFGVAARDGMTTTQSLPWVMLAGFVLIPAAVASVVGGAVGRIIGRR
jgi:hypothetical protein